MSNEGIVEGGRPEMVVVSEFADFVSNLGNEMMGGIFWESEIETFLNDPSFVANLRGEYLEDGLSGMKAYFIRELSTRTEAMKMGNISTVLRKIIDFTPQE